MKKCPSSIRTHDLQIRVVTPFVKLETGDFELHEDDQVGEDDAEGHHQPIVGHRKCLNIIIMI